ncbi:MAG TPA: phosphoribosylformylglycinamidine synthase subunit PurS [Candidatus Thermoplasmatota archaeon]|nr:phosphoribosylformylglycinamidine synthase subunit PurS [Candidatus Thermoplasmatota archaeon]
MGTGSGTATWGFWKVRTCAKQRYLRAGGGRAEASMVTAQVTVHLKPGISDPEGQNTVKALRLLGFDGVTGVHTTRVWTIGLKTKSKEKAREEVDRMCRRLLTNPVVHDYSIKIQE